METNQSASKLNLVDERQMELDETIARLKDSRKKAMNHSYSKRLTNLSPRKIKLTGRCDQFDNQSPQS